MAKHVNIPINGPIGEFLDEYGFMTYGFMPFIVDYLVGYDYENMSLGAPDVEQVTFRLNTPGGGVYEGMEILSKMEALKDKGVIVEVINESRAYSIGSVLLQGATPGHRVSRPYALFMAHKPGVGVDGNADDLRGYADWLDKHEAPMVRVYANASGKTEAEVYALLREERYMTAEEAKAEGFLDTILPFSNADKSPEAANIEKKAVAYYKPKCNENSTNMPTAQAPQTKPVKDEKSFMAHVKAFFVGEDEPETPKATTKKPTPKPKAEEAPAVVAGSISTADDATIYFDGETLTTGTAVFADAELTEALEDGDYDLSDGRTIEVAAGAVANITEPDADDDADASASGEDAPAAQAAAKPKPKEAPEVVALRKELAEAKAQLKVVPGAGGNREKPDQVYADDSNNKGKAHPLDSVAAKIRQK